MLFVFKFPSVTNFGKINNFGLGTIRSGRINKPVGLWCRGYHMTYVHPDLVIKIQVFEANAPWLSYHGVRSEIRRVFQLPFLVHTHLTQENHSSMSD